MTVWAIAVLAAFTILGIVLRWRFGNLWRQAVEAFQRRGGINPRTALMLFGCATVIVWFLVALTVEEDERGGWQELKEFFRLESPQPPQE